jgi:hypothetical protein
LLAAIFPDPHNPEPYECEPGGSVKEAADIYLNDLHIPALKINMGTPFYGYFYTNVTELWGKCENCSNTVLSENCGTFIKQRANQQGWATFYDPISLVPYMLRADGRPGFITYDDGFSTYYRVRYFGVGARSRRNLHVVPGCGLRKPLAGLAGGHVSRQSQATAVMC